MTFWIRCVVAGMFVCSAGSSARSDSEFVPGTGQRLDDCFDDFESANWNYTPRFPKSSHEQDEQQRPPGGSSDNGLWHEGAKRGTPDVVRRVATPASGIAGSRGALMMVTRMSGVPGRISNEQQQDDLLLKVDRKVGRSIPVSWQPSCTVRVYLAPFERWENRSGPSFGVRADCNGRTPDGEVKPYWPGMFILFRSENERGVNADAAVLTVRSGERGNDIRSVEIAEPGWWTLGMSFSADGRIHYYASEGVDDLTADDYLMSSYPYRYRCREFNNFFFNVANMENGRSWSTSWVIDDPEVFVVPPGGQSLAQLYRKRGTSRSARPQVQQSRSRTSSRSRGNSNGPRRSSRSR